MRPIVGIFDVFNNDGFEGFDGGGKLDFDVDIALDDACGIARLAPVAPSILAQHAVNVHQTADPRLTTDRKRGVTWETEKGEGRMNWGTAGGGGKGIRNTNVSLWDQGASEFGGVRIAGVKINGEGAKGERNGVKGI